MTCNCLRNQMNYHSLTNQRLLQQNKKTCYSLVTWPDKLAIEILQIVASFIRHVQNVHKRSKRGSFINFAQIFIFHVRTHLCWILLMAAKCRSNCRLCSDNLAAELSDNFL